MIVYVFRAEYGAFGYTFDETGSTLPEGYGVWNLAKTMRLVPGSQPRIGGPKDDSKFAEHLIKHGYFVR